METIQKNQNLKPQTKNCEDSRKIWTEAEIEVLGEALTFCFKNAKLYDEELDLTVRTKGFKFALQGDFSVEQVLSALREHMKRSTEMFKPAHATAILAPEPIKITTAEYYAAKKKLEDANYYNSYSPEAQLIRDYEKQQEEDRAPLYDNPIHPSLQARLDKANKQALEDKSTGQISHQNNKENENE